ncbi:MAG: SdiA-regulated domain-containing protein, partial [Waterburya sp.]
TKTLIGIFIAVSLVTQVGTNKAVADTCEDNNSGHGDNLAASVTLSSGEVITVTKYDPTNPGSKKNQLKNLLKDGDTGGNGMTIVYSNGAFELSDLQANYVLDNIPDIEANCDYDNDANELIPKLWGIDEDDGQLFVMTNYTDSSTMIDYGKLKWNDNGTVKNIGSDMEAMTLDANGDMYIALDRKLTGSGNAATLLKFNIADASTTADNVVEIIGVIGINFDSSSDNLSGLSIDPNTGQLVALLKNNGSSATDKLYVISKVDGSVIQEIGNITGLGESSTNAEDIEHAPDGNLYVTDNADDHTYKVNSLTGAIIEVVDNNQKDGLDSDSVKFEGLGWDFANNRLIGFDDNDESLAKLTLEAGNNYEYYDTSSMGLTDVEGIDFVPTEDGEPEEFLDYNNDSDGDGFTNDVDPYPFEFTYPD